MRETWLVLIAIVAGGCSCSESDIIGHGDSTTDPGADIIIDGLSDLEPESDALIDAEDECDRDDDGFLALECGGDDCDDLDSTIHPGAAESCGDDIDQDCDGVHADLVLLDDPLPVSDLGTYTMGRLFWTGSDYFIHWWDYDDPEVVHRTFADPVARTTRSIGEWTARFTSYPEGFWTEHGYLAVAWIAEESSGERVATYVLSDPVGGFPAVGAEITRGENIHQIGLAACTGSAVYAWRESSPDVYKLLYIDRAGSPIGSSVVMAEGGYVGDFADVACHGEEAGLAWTSHYLSGEPFSRSDLFFRGIDLSSAEISPTVHLSPEGEDDQRPWMTWADDHFAILSHDGYSADTVFLYGAAVDGTVTMPATALPASGFSPFESAFVSTGEQLAFGWSLGTSSHAETYIQLTSDEGASIGNAIMLPPIEGHSTIHDMVWTGSEIGIIANDGRSENEGLYLMRVGVCE